MTIVWFRQNHYSYFSLLFPSLHIPIRECGLLDCVPRRHFIFCQDITPLLHLILLIPFIWRERDMCLASVNLLTTVQQKVSTTLVEPVQLSYSQNTLLTHQSWQHVWHLLWWSQAKQELAKVVCMMFMARPQAQPLQASVNVLFCVHTVNMSQEVSFFEYNCHSSFKA